MEYGVIGGGQRNRILGQFGAVLGGFYNDAGETAIVGGGESNNAIGKWSGVLGGQLNGAEGDLSVVCGGGGPEGWGNVASESLSVVVGGGANTASGKAAFIGGGKFNQALGEQSVVVGGQNNEANGIRSFLGGGIFNHATGLNSVVSGGSANFATATNTFAAGRNANANHNGTFVWGDDTNSTFASTAANQFLIRASGGVGIGTNAPEGPLHVFESSAGSVIGNADAIAVFERNGHAYLNLLTPNTSESGILFGSPDLSYEGGLIYNSVGTVDGLEFRVSNNLTKMRITNTGRVGIGLLTADISNAITLPNSADITGRGLANAWSTYSSRRWKTDIHTIKDALGTVERLRGVTYRPKDGGSEQIGMIAEEVGEVLPQVVQYEANGVDAQSIDYARLVALLVEGMKEQQKRIESLEKKLERQTP